METSTIPDTDPLDDEARDSEAMWWSLRVSVVSGVVFAVVHAITGSQVMLIPVGLAVIGFMVGPLVGWPRRRTERSHLQAERSAHTRNATATN